MNAENIMASGLLIGIIAMLFYTPYCMAAGIDRMNCGYKRFSFKTIVPIYNMIDAEVNYFGGIKLFTISTVLFIMGVILKVCTWLLMHSNTTINLITTILVVGLFLLLCIANMWFVWVVISDANVVSMAKLIMFAVIFPIGQWYIKNGVCIVVEKRQQKKDTFNR